MTDNPIHHEQLTSNKTTALFVALMILFSLLAAWRIAAVRLDLLAAVLIALACVFLFYTLNYRTLHIRLTSESLQLRFGLFHWQIPLANIAACRLDHLPTLKRLGGAGIHFMFVYGRYRASFNLLEHERILIAFKKKRGPVQDLSFSTARPDTWLAHLHDVLATAPDHPDPA